MMASDGGSRLYEKYINKLRPLGLRIRHMETLKVLVHRFFCLILALEWISRQTFQRVSSALLEILSDPDQSSGSLPDCMSPLD